MTKQADNIRDVKLRAWALNYSVTSIAEACSCTRDAIYQALRDKKREVYLTVQGDTVLNAFEYVGVKKVLGFK